MLRTKPFLATAVASFVFLTPLAIGQTKKPTPPKPSGGDDGTASAEKTATKVNIGAVPKGVDEAIKKNEDKVKKEAEKISGQVGGEFHGAQGLCLAIYAEEPADRLRQLVRMSDTMVFELAKDLEVEPLDDLWAKRFGPFNAYCFKSKATFGDAYREYLEKRFPSHGLNRNRQGIIDTGRFIMSGPSPLAGGEVDDYEGSLAHWMGQTVITYMMRMGPPFKNVKAAVPTEGGTGGSKEQIDGPEQDDGPPKPLPVKPQEKKDKDEALEKEELSWLTEGFAIYASVRFIGANRTYCVSDTKYVGSIAVADKDRDTAYKLICYEVANGTEDKGKDFALLTKTDNNALGYVDLAKSWSFFDFMMRPENRPKLIATLKGMRGPVSFERSLKLATGWSLSDLETNWKKYAMDEYGGKKKKPTGPEPKKK